MKVTNYLQNHQIKYFPVKLEFFEETKKTIPIGGHYKDFFLKSAKELSTRQAKNIDYPLIGLNTFQQVILDIDNLENFKEKFPNIEKQLNDECIYYKSRNKRLPHYMIT